MSFHNPSRSGGLRRHFVIWVLPMLPLYGCSVQQSYLEKNFPPDFVSKARSNFDVDVTDWDILANQTIPKRARLVFHGESGVSSDVQAFCRDKLVKNLMSRGIEIDPNVPAELIVCIVRASEIRKPVRRAKVRIAVKLSLNEGAEIVFQGIADGIESRPDLSEGVWMPKSSYLRASQQAISKFIRQLDNITKTTPSSR